MCIEIKITKFKHEYGQCNKVRPKNFHIASHIGQSLSYGPYKRCLVRHFKEVYCNLLQSIQRNNFIIIQTLLLCSTRVTTNLEYSGNFLCLRENSGKSLRIVKWCSCLTVIYYTTAFTVLDNFLFDCCA